MFLRCCIVVAAGIAASFLATESRPLFFLLAHLDARVSFGIPFSDETVVSILIASFLAALVLHSA
jgi:hypothetical protein